MPGFAEIRLLQLDIEEFDIVFANILLGKTELLAMAEAEFGGFDLTLRNLHIQGPGGNSVGSRYLRRLAQWTMDLVDVDELRIEGATRTSGANPGRRPALVIFPPARWSWCCEERGHSINRSPWRNGSVKSV